MCVISTFLPECVQDRGTTSSGAYARTSLGRVKRKPHLQQKRAWAGNGVLQDGQWDMIPSRSDDSRSISHLNGVMKSSSSRLMQCERIYTRQRDQVPRSRDRQSNEKRFLRAQDVNPKHDYR